MVSLGERGEPFEMRLPLYHNLGTSDIAWSGSYNAQYYLSFILLITQKSQLVEDPDANNRWLFWIFHLFGDSLKYTEKSLVLLYLDW